MHAASAARRVAGRLFSRAGGDVIPGRVHFVSEGSLVEKRPFGHLSDSDLVDAYGNAAMKAGRIGLVISATSELDWERMQHLRAEIKVRLAAVLTANRATP